MGNGYVVSLPDWVPDGDLVFLPHTQIARIEGSSGRISTLKLVPDSQETITLTVDRFESGLDQEAPNLNIDTPVVTEVDGQHQILVNGNISDVSNVEFLIFNIFANWDLETFVLSGENVQPDGSFSFTQQFNDVNDSQSISLIHAYAFDEYGNGRLTVVDETWMGSSSFSSSLLEPSPSTPASFLYLELGQEINQTLTNDMFGLNEDVSLTNYAIQPADWMAGGGDVDAPVNSSTGELAGTNEFYLNSMIKS